MFRRTYVKTTTGGGHSQSDIHASRGLLHLQLVKRMHQVLVPQAVAVTERDGFGLGLVGDEAVRDETLEDGLVDAHDPSLAPAERLVEVPQDVHFQRDAQQGAKDG